MDINITMCIFLFLFDVGEAVEGGWGGSDGMGEGARAENGERSRVRQSTQTRANNFAFVLEYVLLDCIIECRMAQNGSLCIELWPVLVFNFS